MMHPVDRYAWPEGKQSAACFSVDVDATAPLLWDKRNGFPNLLGQLEARRFGQRVGIFRLLDLLDRFGLKGSFFVPGVVAETFPALLPRLVDAGHEIGLHGYFHEIVTDIDDAEFSRALEASLTLFERQTGVRPKGFRSPAWEMTPHMLAEVKRHGLYDSSLMGFDHPYTMDGVTEIPVQWTVDDAIYFRFRGGGVDKWPPQAPRPVLEGWLDEWRLLHRFGGLFMLTVHDWISGRAQRIALLERLLAEVTADPAVWMATVGEIAAHHEANQRDRYPVSADLPADFSDHPARRG